MPIGKQKPRVQKSGFNRQLKIVNQRWVEVGAALIFHCGKLLITQRNARSHLGGLWEFPGGKRETGETFEQCLVREIREEVGVKIFVSGLFEEISHAYPEKSVHLKFFICKLISGEPQPLDCAAVKWIEKSQLSAHEFPAADAQLLETLRGAQEWNWQSATARRSALTTVNKTEINSIKKTNF
jgi:8-oxo-dGTP diphosphatase